jgi:CheY-like chemotaxis protein
VGNAIKFTRRGDVLIRVTLKQTKDFLAELLFEVKDTGIGIPKEKHDRLFQAFMQVDSSTTRKYGGTGLGLAISKRLTELMGGTIGFESEPGKGANFYFTICVKPCVPENITHSKPDNHTLQGKRVLIIDDNENSRCILKKQLETWNALPQYAAGGKEALEILSNETPFDLVITDRLMPNIDGIETAAKIKAQYPGMPIILLDFIGAENSPEKENLFSSILTKPIKQLSLLKEVNNALQKKHEKKMECFVEKTVLSTSFAKDFPMEILVAEDTAINQAIINMILNKLGYEVDLVGDGRQVIEMIKNKTYDVILMDVQMPEMDGMEATTIIRKEMAYQPIIVALTANAMAEDKDACLKTGMDDYISKPIQIEELKEVLVRCAQRQARKKIA